MFIFTTPPATHNEPCGPLRTLNDEALGPGMTITHTAKRQLEIIVIPVIGACECRTDSVHFKADIGQVMHFPLEPVQTVRISNKFLGHPISYLFIEIDSVCPVESEVIGFNLEESLNSLHQLKIRSGHDLSIGLYDWRHEGCLSFGQHDQQYFVYVIEGAFEAFRWGDDPRDQAGILSLQAVFGL
jgi:hypothetical protein